jgi:ABC-type antimicrobial peptide transport system permease subunit
MSLKRFAAIVVTTALGAAIGLVVGYLTSGYVGMSAGFYYWITYPIDSWHWPILGGLVGALASAALHLWIPDRSTPEGR